MLEAFHSFCLRCRQENMHMHKYRRSNTDKKSSSFFFTTPALTSTQVEKQTNSGYLFIKQYFILKKQQRSISLGV